MGRLAPTGTPWDRAILVPVETVWLVHGLANGHAPERAAQSGPPFDAACFPGTPAIVVRSQALWATCALRSEFTGDRETMAFFPGALHAVHAWIRATDDDTACVFVELENEGDAPIQISGAEADIAHSGSLLGFALKNGDAAWAEVPSVPVAPGAICILNPTRWRSALAG